MFKVLRTGCQWRELASNLVSPKTIHNYFRRWSEAGIFKTAYQKILAYVRRQKPDLYYAVDSTLIKNIGGRNCLGGNHADRGRNASKISVIVNNNGIPLNIKIFPGNRHDSILFRSTIENSLVRLTHRLPVHADKAYDNRPCRKVLQDNHLNDAILKKRVYNSPILQKNRLVVEHFFAWLKMYRRLILRYDHKVSNYLAFVYLASSSIALAK